MVIKAFYSINYNTDPFESDEVYWSMQDGGARSNERE